MAGDVFSPEATSSLTATGTAANVSLKSSLSPCTVRIYRPAMATNETTPAVFIKFGVSTDTATTGDMPIQPGSVEVFQMQAGHTHLCMVTTGASLTVYATVGRGQ